MRLELKASSKLGIGYTPDWIQYDYINPETGGVETLTMDIRGEIAYNLDGLNVSVKGELAPFSFYDGNSGEETDLTELDSKEDEKYISLFNQFFASGKNFLIGVCPVQVQRERFKEVDGYKTERFSNCSGVYRFAVDGEEREFEFSFYCEINE